MAIDKSVQQDLEKVLEDLVHQLVKQGLLPALSPQQKKDLVKEVSKNLMADPDIYLRKEDLHKDSIKKMLGLACMAECNPKNKFDYKILFKTPRELKKDELKAVLAFLFTELLKLKMGKDLKLTPEQKTNIDQRLDDLTSKLERQFEKNSDESLGENNNAFKLFAAVLDLLSEQRRACYGVDTHITGSVFKPVPPAYVGDQIVRPNLSGGEGDSFEAEKEKPNPNIPDPLGIHLFTLINDVAIDAILPEVESTLASEGMFYESPKPRGPGGIPSH